MDTNSIRHKDIVKRFLDAKAIDFTAVGKAFGELAPGVAQADEPGDFYCGVGRNFFHCFGPVTGVVAVEQVAQEL
ncbi:MAG: hypothetical protein M3Y07_08060 [Acidobacteriota bacterium]|nr:hypothetical protein [Acidobacteriota bacterium]